MQPRPTQYTVQNKIKETEGLITQFLDFEGKQDSRSNRSTTYNRNKMPAVLTRERRMKVLKGLGNKKQLKTYLFIYLFILFNQVSDLQLQ